MEDIQIKLTEFSDPITRYTADFVSREWLVKQVESLFDDPECRFVLTGGPGVGKTAIAARLRQTLEMPPSIGGASWPIGMHGGGLRFMSR